MSKNVHDNAKSKIRRAINLSLFYDFFLRQQSRRILLHST